MGRWVKETVYKATIESDILTVDELFRTVAETLNPSIRAVDSFIKITNDGIKIRVDKKYDHVLLIADISESDCPSDVIEKKLDEILECVKHNVAQVEVVKKALKILDITK